MKDCASCKHFLPEELCREGDVPNMRELGYRGSCARPGLFHRVVFILARYGRTSCGYHGEANDKPVA